LKTLRAEEVVVKLIRVDCLHLSALPAFIRMIGVPINGIWNLQSHEIGKQNTQKIERKHLTLRTRIKRLARKTICFSKTVRMHDIVIGLFVNRYEFGVLV
jgi:hypothetical protein